MQVINRMLTLLILNPFDQVLPDGLPRARIALRKIVACVRVVEGFDSDMLEEFVQACWVLALISFGAPEIG
jgi:hypothetical protein